MHEYPLLDGGEIDRRLSLRPGTAIRLAKRDQLKHLVLPDGTIRFSWLDVVESLKSVNIPRLESTGAAHE